MTSSFGPGQPRPPGRSGAPAATAHRPVPAGRSSVPRTSWWHGLGFVHGVVLGAAGMAVVVALVALVAWGLSITGRAGPVVEDSISTNNHDATAERQSLDPSASLGPSESPQAPVEPPPEFSDAAALAAALAVLDEPVGGYVGGYDRTLFGQAWYDSDGNGCDTRNDILRRDLSDIVIKSDSNGCKVLRGSLIDPYSGDAMTFVSGVGTSVLVQIDHVVPLAWAWDNGASTWTTEQRQDFANDPLNLLAVSGELNQEKSASGPASWLPPNRAAHCAYVTIFAEVLIDYRLSLPSNDREVLTQVLNGC